MPTYRSLIHPPPPKLLWHLQETKEVDFYYEPLFRGSNFNQQVRDLERISRQPKGWESKIQIAKFSFRHFSAPEHLIFKFLSLTPKII